MVIKLVLLVSLCSYKRTLYGGSARLSFTLLIGYSSTLALEQFEHFVEDVVQVIACFYGSLVDL